MTLHSPSQIINPLARVRRFGFGTGSSGATVPSLPSGATNRWTAPTTGSNGDLIDTLVNSLAANNGGAAGSARPTLLTAGNGLNGLNVLRFDGVANCINLASSIAGVNTYTIAAVVKRIGADVCPLGTSNYLPGMIRTATGIITGDAVSYAAATNASTGWEIIVAGRSGTASFGQRNGAALSFGSNTAFVTAALFNKIGARSTTFTSGDIADIIYWPSALTTQQMSDVSANLNSTWGGVY